MPGPTGPTGAAGSGGSLPSFAYVANADGSLSVIDPVTHQVIKTIATGLSINGLVDDCPLRRLYAFDAAANILLVLDSSSNAELARFPLGGVTRAAAGEVRPAVNPNNHMVYVPLGSNGTVAVVNGFGSALIGQIAVGGVPVAAAVGQKTNLVYIANNTNVIPVINSNNNTVFTSLSLPGSAAATDIITDPCDSRVYALRSDGSITVLNGLTNAVEETFTPPGGAAALALDPSLSLLYVIDAARQRVLVYDTCTMQQIGELAVVVSEGTRFEQLAVNFVTHLVYLTDSASGSTQIIDGGLNTVVEQVDAGGGAVVCMNCNPNCPRCVGGGDCDCCCGESETAAQLPVLAARDSTAALFTAQGELQTPAEGAALVFPQVGLNEGGAARPLDASQIQLRQAGIYELHLRLPLRTARQGICSLGYALLVNGHAVARDELHHPGGSGRLFTASLTRFERLYPGDLVSVALGECLPSGRTGMSIEGAYFALRRVG